jgi:prepilin-type N-terminal cleavage/methylation domain-containing protein
MKHFLPPSQESHRRRVRHRRGMSLLEVMVALAIGVALMVVALPAIGAAFALEQHRAAKDLALLYQQLHDEAIMRNVTFRIGFNLSDNSYTVEAGDPQSLVFENSEQRDEYRDVMRERIEAASDEEIDNRTKPQAFQKFNAAYATKRTLPSGTIFAGVYTPQYKEMVRLRKFDADKEGGGTLVYSYIFASGFSEQTVVEIALEGDPTDGYTVEVEPLSGVVSLHSMIIDWEDSFEFVPEEGPSLSN